MVILLYFHLSFTILIYISSLLILVKIFQINDILLQIGTGSPSTITSALSFLKILTENHKEALSQHIVSIMGLLVKVSDLDLMQIRILIDVMAELIFYNSVESCDELQIFIQKQLSSPKVEHCKKGIVAAVMFAKHVGKHEDGEWNHSQTNSILGCIIIIIILII